MARGEYGTDRSSSTPWWQLAIGVTVVLGAGYLITRPLIKETNSAIGELRNRVREVGIKPGMSQAAQDRSWDAYYAKHGLKLENGELVKVR